MAKKKLRKFKVYKVHFHGMVEIEAKDEAAAQEQVEMSMYLDLARDASDDADVEVTRVQDGGEAQ